MNSRLIILTWVLYLLFALHLLTQDTEITSDLTFFLPKATQPAEKLLLLATREGPGSRMLLAEIEGGNQKDRFIASDALVTRLRSLNQFARIQGGLDPHDLHQLEERLFSYRYLLTPISSEQWNTAHLHDALEQRAQRLLSGSGRLEERWLERDPLGSWKHYLDQLSTGPMPKLVAGHWVNTTEDAALILIETRTAGFDLTAQEKAQTLVVNTFNAMPHAGMSLSLGGAGALAVDTNRSITRQATWLSILNTLMVSGLLILVYRSTRILVLGLIPLLTGLITGALAIRLEFGAIHAITLGFGSTLLGVAADYPNHFFTHLSSTTPSHTTMRRLWPTLRLGILTNIAGFGVMLFSGFRGLQEIGIFASAGLIGAGLSTRFILPSLSPSRAGIGAWMTHLSHNPSHKLSRRTRLLLCILVPVSLIGLFQWSGRSLFNDDLASLNPVDPTRLETDLSLQRAFRVPDMRWLVLINGATEEEALTRSESLQPILSALVKEHALSGYDLVSSLLPSQNTQIARRMALPSSEAAAISLQQAIKGTPFKAHAFDPLIIDLLRYPTLPPVSRETYKGTILEPRIDAQLYPSSEGTAILVPLEGIAKIETVQKAIQSLRDSRVQLIDLQGAMTQRINENRREASRLLAWGFLGIFFILAIGLQSIFEAIRVITPMVLATLSTAVFLALGSTGLNIYHLASILLVMGLSLDQALFFNRPCSDPEDRSRTHLSILVCSLSSILAFGGLAFSSVPLLAAIGTTVSIGAFLAISFAALLAK